MSKYAVFATTFRSEEHLLAALKGLGLEPIEVHAELTQMYGYGGEPVQHAHIIIRRHHSRSVNDLGFRREADGCYNAVIDVLDRDKFHDGWMGRLKQGYAEAKQIAMAKIKGYAFIGRKEVNGKVQLRFIAR